MLNLKLQLSDMHQVTTCELTTHAQADDGDGIYAPDVKRDLVSSSFLSSKRRGFLCSLLCNHIPALREAHINQNPKPTFNRELSYEPIPRTQQLTVNHMIIISLVCAPFNKSTRNKCKHIQIFCLNGADWSLMYVHFNQK